jgi:hypothetical protein
VANANPSQNTRFQMGNPGGPGRPRKLVERTFLEIAANQCTDEDWEAIVDRAVEDAKAGHARARNWLTKILLGDDPHAVIEMNERFEIMNEFLVQRGLAKRGADGTWSYCFPQQSAFEPVPDPTTREPDEKLCSAPRQDPQAPGQSYGPGRTPDDPGFLAGCPAPLFR